MQDPNKDFYLEQLEEDREIDRQNEIFTERYDDVVDMAFEAMLEEMESSNNAIFHRILDDYNNDLLNMHDVIVRYYGEIEAQKFYDACNLQAQVW